MDIYALLKANRARFNEDVGDSPNRHWFSASTLNRYEQAHKRMATHLSGKVLDVGCGDMALRRLASEYADTYEGLDIERRTPDLTYVEDVQDMRGIPTGKYDAVLCFELLEHVPDPLKALCEVYRVLGKGGRLIGSVPHLARLHEEPNDFFRYTKYGLRFLLERAQFRVLEIAPRAGLVTFLSHQFSTVLLGMSWHIPILGRAAFLVNKWLVVRPSLALDRLLDRRKVFAMGYVFVAEKPQ